MGLAPAQNARAPRPLGWASLCSRLTREEGPPATEALPDPGQAPASRPLHLEHPPAPGPAEEQRVPRFSRCFRTLLGTALGRPGAQVQPWLPVSLQTACAGSFWKVLGLCRPHRSGHSDVLGAHVGAREQAAPGIIRTTRDWLQLGKVVTQFLRSRGAWVKGTAEARAAESVVPTTLRDTRADRRVLGSNRSGDLAGSPTVFQATFCGSSTSLVPASQERRKVTAGQSTRRARPGPCWPVLPWPASPQLYHGRKTTTSQLLPDTFAFPGTLVSVSKNTKLVPKPWRKTSLSPARGSLQASSSSEKRLQPPSQWALSPHGPHATWDTVTPRGKPQDTRHTAPSETVANGGPEQPRKTHSPPQSPRAGIHRGRSEAMVATQPEPLQLTPAWGRPGQGPLPGAGHEHNSQRKPWGLGWPHAGTGRAGPGRVNLSSGVHGPGQPFQAGPPPAQLEALVSKAGVLALNLQGESGEVERRDSL